METMVMVKYGSLNAMLTSLAFSMDAKKAGVDVGMFFTEEAVAALMDKKFYEMPEGLKKHSKEIADNAAKMGIPIPKEPTELIPAAKEAGIPIIGCPAWSAFLGAVGKLPADITIWDFPTFWKEFPAVKRIVSF